MATLTWEERTDKFAQMNKTELRHVLATVTMFLQDEACREIAAIAYLNDCGFNALADQEKANLRVLDRVDSCVDKSIEHVEEMRAVGFGYGTLLDCDK